MFDTSWIDDLDADAACRAVVEAQVELRRAEWHELALAAHWADLHDEHTLAPGPVLPGTERALRIGGPGTPPVAEFASAELGVLMGTGPVSAENLVRDALDLRHRHPRLWAALAAGKGRVWKARKVAKMVHAAGLSLEQARAVDVATTPYVDGLPWKPFSDLVEAKIMEADPAAAACLSADGDTDPVDVRRSKAVGLLAQPALALALLQRHAAVAPLDLEEPVDEEGPEPAATPEPVPFPVDPERLRPQVTLYVRVSEESLASGSGVAVCGGSGGAGNVGVVTVQAIKDLLGHSRVTVRPVLDLREQLPVDAYEVPTGMREALKLSRLSSVFPFTHTTGEPDLDHTKAYLSREEGGPPGQTRIDNLGPLTRFTHRVKTHGRGWRHHQPVPGVYLWRTPHGYWVRVDRHGSRHLPPHAAVSLESPSALERAFARLVLAA